MLNIDFLPTEYRQRVRQRRSQSWRIVVAAAMVGLVAAAAITQHYRWRRVRADLAAVTPAYVAAVNVQSRLADVQRQLDQARRVQELYTYLRHPWPRTQLLAAMLGPLPDEITLQQVQILGEPAGVSSPAEARPAVEAKTQEASLASLLPAQRDLAKLRDRMDPTRTVDDPYRHGRRKFRAAPLPRRIGRRGNLRQSGVGLVRERRRRQVAPVPNRARRSAGIRPTGGPTGGNPR